jgi:hypothetical protein
MAAIVILLAFIGLCVLAAGYGTDSRSDRPGRQL